MTLSTVFSLFCDPQNTPAFIHEYLRPCAFVCFAVFVVVCECLDNLAARMSSDRLSRREYQLGQALQAWNDGEFDLGMTRYEDHVREFPTGTGKELESHEHAHMP